MLLGIDLGTTRTLVAAADRGNFPVVGFLDDDGELHEHLPSVVAAVDGRLVYGLDAVAAARDGAPVVRSFKRLLASPAVHGDQPVRIGDVEVPLSSLLTGFVVAVRDAVLHKSNAPRKKNDPALTAAVAVPAHAHAAQRFLTLEAFKRAGFDVKAMLHEPSAAGLEYTHRQPQSLSSKRTRVIVYDLGGGTFDASLVRVDGFHHEVVGSAGLNQLGGDDFDDALLSCALAQKKLDRAALSATTLDALREACRAAKERLTAQAKKVALDFSEQGHGEVSVTVDAFHAAAAPLVEQTLAAMQPLLGELDGDPMADVAGVYLVGGASGLPLVPRLLKERFGRRVFRSPYPAGSTAIGLAIAVSNEVGFTLKDRFSRCLGVFRERDAGRGLRFDTIFDPKRTLPPTGESITVARRYRARHNVGHFRYVECSRVDGAGDPVGDVVPVGDILFPFDAALRDQTSLVDVTVQRTDAGPEVEESYRIDPAGLVAVTITDLARGYTRAYTLGSG
ncbi:MAG: Hsp70 family protein [Deltaproteobacteria bacterium]|nr:Hsp70 family protein [Deltaproteobacteria bacterium]